MEKASSPLISKVFSDTKSKSYTQFKLPIPYRSLTTETSDNSVDNPTLAEAVDSN